MSIDLFQPFFSPEVKARAITRPKFLSPLAQESFQENEAFAFLDPIVALIEESLHWL
jgi:hypothetical protein